MEFRPKIGRPKRILVKIGSSVITDQNGDIDLVSLQSVCNDLAKLVQDGIELVFVTSGAINAGRSALKNFDAEKIDSLQAASSLGQPILINHYAKILALQNIQIAQILLIHNDFINEQRFANVKNTLLNLIENSVIPILNENDAVSYEEITVGDNDNLAVMTAKMLEVDLLLMISSSDGLYDKNPDAEDAKRIKSVDNNFDYDTLHLDSKSCSGRGGMKTKISAINEAVNAGIRCIVSGKTEKNPILRALTEDVGTVFEINDD